MQIVQRPTAVTVFLTTAVTVVFQSLALGVARRFLPTPHSPERNRVALEPWNLGTCCLQSWVDVKISKSDQNNLHIRFSWEFEPPFNAFDWNTTRQGQKQQEEENTKNTSPEHDKIAKKRARSIQNENKAQQTCPVCWLPCAFSSALLFFWYRIVRAGGQKHWKSTRKSMRKNKTHRSSHTDRAKWCVSFSSL